MSGLSFPRRWFLGLTTLLTLLGSARARVLGAIVPTPAPVLAADLIRLLPGRPDAAVIGRAYLVSHPEEADIGLIARHLKGLAGPDLRSAIATRLRRDFEDRNTVRLHGWVLGRTEARLYALCALLQDSERLTAGLHGAAPA